MSAEQQIREQPTLMGSSQDGEPEDLDGKKYVGIDVRSLSKSLDAYLLDH